MHRENSNSLDSSKVIIYIFLGFFAGILGCAAVLFFLVAVVPLFFIDKAVGFIFYEYPKEERYMLC